MPQVFQQRRILARQRQPSAASASNFLSGGGRRQIAQPAIDRAARDSRRPRNSGHAAKPGRARLRRREQATPPFVEARTQRLIPLPNRCFINHAAVINQTSASRNPHAKSIQLFCGIALSWQSTPATRAGWWLLMCPDLGISRQSRRLLRLPTRSRLRSKAIVDAQRRPDGLSIA